MTKEQIKQEIIQSVNPIRFDMTNLIFPFGFTRMDGESIMLMKLVSSRTEEQIQTAPLPQVHKNIEEWCRQEKIKYQYDFVKDRYIFQHDAH